MISASEIHELRFEKAAFGYKQEDIRADGGFITSLCLLACRKRAKRNCNA